MYFDLNGIWNTNYIVSLFEGRLVVADYYRTILMILYSTILIAIGGDIY